MSEWVKFDPSKLKKGKYYLFWGINHKGASFEYESILGCGVWAVKFIIEAPTTCGCNGIYIDDVTKTMDIEIPVQDQ